MAILFDPFITDPQTKQRYDPYLLGYLHGLLDEVYRQFKECKWEQDYPDFAIGLEDARGDKRVMSKDEISRQVSEVQSIVKIQ